MLHSTITCLCALTVLALPGFAVDGVDEQEIRIGQCAALSGPAAGLGNGVRLGLEAAFAEANAAGGVHGRKLHLIAVDDGYEPDRCADGTVKLIEEDKVFCLAGYVGTPTAKVAVDIVEEKKTPLVGLFTGAMLLRAPVRSQVINLRASYDDETAALVARLVEDLGVKSIAVFHQNDSFGQAGLSGTEKALAKRGMAVTAKGSFERNTLAVKTGLTAILAAKPDAVVMVGPYKPIAAFIKEARAAGLTVPLATISFVGTENLIAEAGAAAEGVVISQVVPSPADEAVPLVAAYRKALAAHDAKAKPSYVSLEGYANGRLLILALDKAGKDVSRPGLLAAIEGLKNVDLGGLSVTFAADDHQGSDAVFVTRVKAAAAVPVVKLAP